MEEILGKEISEEVARDLLNRIIEKIPEKTKTKVLKEFAKKLGISRQYIYAWKDGKRKISIEYRGKIVELALQELGEEAKEIVYPRIAEYLAKLQNSLKTQGFFFTFGKSKLPIKAFIESAEEKVDFATFSVDPKGLKQILEWGAKNEIKVRVAYAMPSNREEVIKVANEGGVELRSVKNLHAKFAVIDGGEAAIITSCNLSSRSLDFNGNVEVCVALRSPEVSFLSEIFKRIWSGKSLDKLDISFEGNENIKIIWNKGKHSSYLRELISQLRESESLTIASQAWNPAIVSSIKGLTENSEVKAMVSSGGWGKETREGIEELLKWKNSRSNLEIYKVPNLHAKIISSNNAVIMGSLNFSSSSFECRTYEVGVIIKEKKLIDFIEPTLAEFCKDKNKLSSLEEAKSIDVEEDYSIKVMPDHEVCGISELEKLALTNQSARSLKNELEKWKKNRRKETKKSITPKPYAKIKTSTFKKRCEKDWKFQPGEYLIKRIESHLKKGKKTIVILEVPFDQSDSRLYYGTMNAIYKAVNNLDWIRIRNAQTSWENGFIKNLKIEFIKEIDLERIREIIKKESKDIEAEIRAEGIKRFLVVNDTIKVYESGKIVGDGTLRNTVKEIIDTMILG